MKVQCISPRSTEQDPQFGTVMVEHALSMGGVYEVVGIEAGSYRIIDDEGEPALFDPSLFTVVDARRPSHWVVTVQDGTEYAYAPELSAPGFFEDYHEGDPSAVRVFVHYLNQHLRLTDAA